MSTAPWQPPQAYPVIVAGADWHWEYPPFKHSGTLGPLGAVFDWTEEPTRWFLQAALRDKNDQLLATLASGGTRDGDITGQADGIVAFDLVAAKTALLPITRSYTNSADPRLSPWPYRAVHPFDLIVTDLETDEVWPLVAGLVTVQQSPTA